MQDVCCLIHIYISLHCTYFTSNSVVDTEFPSSHLEINGDAKKKKKCLWKIGYEYVLLFIHYIHTHIHALYCGILVLMKIMFKQSPPTLIHAIHKDDVAQNWDKLF